MIIICIVGLKTAAFCEKFWVFKELTSMMKQEEDLNSFSEY